MKEFPQNFSQFLNEAVKLKGINLKKLAENTNIPFVYLEAFKDRDYSKLPPLPYVRGYVFKIADALGYKGDEIWEMYKEEILIKIKTEDKLPSNRFSFKKINRSIVFVGILLFFAIIYLAFYYGNIFGIPELTIIYPDKKEIITTEPIIEIYGKASEKDKVLINNKEVPVENSEFYSTVWLQLGVNKITVEAKRFLGRKKKINFKVIYQPPQEEIKEEIKLETPRE